MYTFTITASVRRHGAIGIFYLESFKVQSTDRDPNRETIVNLFLEQHGHEWELNHIEPRPTNEPDAE